MGSSWRRGHKSWRWLRGGFVVDGSRNVFYGTRQKVELMDYAVGGGHSRLGEITVEEFNCIREKNMLGDSIEHVEASVVLERRANVETLTAAEVL